MSAHLLTRDDVNAAQGAYGEPIAATAWGYGYSSARARARGFVKDADLFLARYEQLSARCDDAAQRFLAERFCAGVVDGYASVADDC